ncbi:MULTISPECIES: glutaredoxin family protein [Cryobacterium]|uniref:Glutaredoxin family protein n=1 Tax=Cryobacterium zongtaii TaxID=1259217 RepID=A0A2S3Z6S5_9MICO|nr:MULTISPECIES: glutaredoxin family protein [Cryobacterium]ASD20882.1 thioredoxin family protein [Cryobacterium sp. LW097]POH60862.1 glutaredoxin family protein [Cryobacterium zongtaii]POH69608.1 glutaredoxin family protein [Cryobacterium zongtaii]TFC44301.1 glutaredoxin family protein [Cryobacterium sp. TMN-39-2]TFC52530.1 glutaredoxin family protein [Cryobacterium sp. TMB3-1-2]
MSTAHLTLIGKPGCHLCDDALGVVTTVLAELAAEPGSPTVLLEEKSILDDPELHELYVEDIPVLLINGLVHNYWRIDPARLRTALLEVR